VPEHRPNAAGKTARRATATRLKLYPTPRISRLAFLDKDRNKDPTHCRPPRATPHLFLRSWDKKPGPLRNKRRIGFYEGTRNQKIGPVAGEFPPPPPPPPPPPKRSFWPFLFYRGLARKGGGGFSGR